MKKKILSLIMLIIIGMVAHHYYVKIRDKEIANEAYQQMVILDKQLDQLKILADNLHHEKDINSQVINGFNELNKENFLDQKAGFINLVKQIDYNRTVESQILLIMESTNNVVLFKVARKQVKTQLQLLKYNYGLQVESFNTQISQITEQVKKLNQQIQTIDSENLQDQELAKLGFISKKLSKTVVELNGSFIDRILSDVVEKDRISEKDSDGDE